MRGKGTLVVVLAGALAASCARKAAEPKAEAETFAVTAWGDAFEVFAEIDALVAGKPARSNTHVTVLAGGAPLRRGTVAAVLRDASGRERVFEKREPKRDGIYLIEVRPPADGTYALSFRIAAEGGAAEEVAAGDVRVGGEPRSHEEAEGEISFLKEQQWKTAFATAWARERVLEASVTGPARVVPAAGGEVVLTAPVDAVLAPAPWPHRGTAVAAGAPVFRLVPRVAGSRSLAELEADAAVLEAEASAASARARRLEELVKVEAVSAAEVERAQAQESAQKARLSAAHRDLATARAARGGGRAVEGVAVLAPFASLVAEVHATPGRSVAAGEPLARLVRTRPVWLDVALPPAEAARAAGARGLFVRLPGAAQPLAVAASEMRVVSRAPEVDARTGTVGVLVEVDRSAAELPLGSVAEAELLLPGERRGVVVPATALVDDGGLTVVYEQVSGESFRRHEVKVAGRRGPEVLVTGLPAGIRVVTAGGADIRRATLLSSGTPEGHVH